LPARNTPVQLLAPYTDPDRHNAQRYSLTDRRTDKRTDGRHDDANRWRLRRMAIGKYFFLPYQPDCGYFFFLHFFCLYYSFINAQHIMTLNI